MKTLKINADHKFSPDGATVRTVKEGDEIVATNALAKMLTETKVADSDGKEVAVASIVKATKKGKKEDEGKLDKMPGT